MTTKRVLATVRLGARAGLAGTAAMTMPIMVGRAFGLLAIPPPVEISNNAARRLPLLPERGQSGFSGVWLGSHLLYGATCGVMFTLGRRWLPTAPLPAGLLFGTMVWATSYLGIVPALGLYPSATHDRRSRLLVMVAAHAMYGVTVAWVSKRGAGR